MQSLFLRSVAIVQFYMWYSGAITKSNAVVRCWHETDQTAGLTMSVVRGTADSPRMALHIRV